MVLLSRDGAYDVRDFIMVAPVTTQRRNIPAEVSLGPEDGLPRASVVNLDTIDTVAKNSLQRQMATLSPEKLQAVEEAIRFALGLEQ